MMKHYKPFIAVVIIKKYIHLQHNINMIYNIMNKNYTKIS